jgi:hypothetical protein
MCIFKFYFIFSLCLNASFTYKFFFIINFILDFVCRLGVTLRVIDSSHSLIPIVDAITMQDRQLQVSSIPPADRISALPDIVIDHILYFLPTKDAAATMFLSKRWKLETTLVLTIATQVR